MDHLPDDVPAGTAVHVDYRKWSDGLAGTTTEHWQADVTMLGTDGFGCWLGMPAGTEWAKPTYRHRLPFPHVKLITERGWSADIGRPPTSSQSPIVYADMITVPVWTRSPGLRVTMIDLDLDVIVWSDGTLMIDDEDEFDDHRTSRHYPAEAVDLARGACAEVHRALAAGAEPFHAVADRWLARVPG